MPRKSTLRMDELLKEGRTMSGALGAISFGVLRGLQAGGADAKIVASVRVLMQEHFQRMSDVDCNMLCDTVYKLLSDEARREGSWY